MENRQPIHHHRNTIAPPPGVAKHRRKLQKLGRGGRDHTANAPANRENKTYARLKCNWCPAEFTQYEIICPRCLNCQYCGLMVEGSFLVCPFCNNVAPAETKHKPTKLKRKHFG